MKKSKKIFIGISETSGYYGRLYSGLKQLGMECFFAELTPNKHNYSYKYVHDNFLTKICKSSYIKNPVLFHIVKIIIFIWALLKFDTFVFTGCNSFWNNRELWVYRMLRKKTVMICLGWKTRLPYANGPDINIRNIENNESTSISLLIKEMEDRKKFVENIEKNIDVFINMPAQAQLNKKKFVSFAYLGIALDLEDKLPLDKAETTKKIRILHAASTLGCRGTKEFKECIIQLQKKYDIDYVELSGVPNEVVIEEIRKCDFILDELWSDTPMATFASEAAYYGKPAIVCSYFSPFYKKYYPKGSCPPSLFTLPENLNEAVEKMICDVDYRLNLGQQAQKFVKKYMNCKAVARRFCKVINGEIDKEWIVDPLEIGYIEGYGIDKEVQKRIIKTIYRKCGIEKMGTLGNDLLTQKIMGIVNYGDS